VHGSALGAAPQRRGPRRAITTLLLLAAATAAFAAGAGASTAGASTDAGDATGSAGQGGACPSGSTAAHCQQQQQQQQQQQEQQQPPRPPGGAAQQQDLFDRIDELYQKERDRQRKMSFEDADREENGPKEISIFCPQSPQVRIVDLPAGADNEDECMVLNLSAPDMNSRLVINCHGKRTMSTPPPGASDSGAGDGSDADHAAA